MAVMSQPLIFTEDGVELTEISFEEFIALNVEAMQLDDQEAAEFRSEIESDLSEYGGHRAGGGAAGKSLICTREALSKHLEWVR